MFNFLLQGKVGEMMAPIKSPEAQLLIAIQNGQRDKVRAVLNPLHNCGSLMKAGLFCHSLLLKRGSIFAFSEAP